MSATDGEIQGDRGLEDLLTFIRDSRGFDFTGYKRTSLARRIRKRMQTVKIDGYAEYRDFLEINAGEFMELFNTILINVTGFFRDPEAWNYLQTTVVPEIVARVGEEGEIRIWSAGCSSGEEAYSLAISFAEHLGVEEATRRVKIYGTDVDEEALREARAGVYPSKALDRLPDGLKKKYFEPTGNLFAFRRDLRRRVIFGRHDITRDAPISRVDLLACRNTLMYFNVEAQAKIIERFHFALNEGGYLFLGKAEMLLSDGIRFDAASIRNRVFKLRTGSMPVKAARFDVRAGAAVRDANRRRHVTELALASSPDSVLCVERDGTVALINGSARSQFGLSSDDVGRPFHDLEISYRPIELRSVIDQAHAERRSVRIDSVRRQKSAEETQYLDIIVRPLITVEGEDIGVAITFVDTSEATRLQQEVKRVQEDLATAYAELQSTNAELETVNEELQSSIGELETTNEELQSTNEELETTNEELQSGNEELETMNEEMRIRTAELDETRMFFEGVLSSVEAGVVVLDGDLQVRSWNRSAQELWGLRADEVYRQDFFGLDFGLPTAGLRDTVEGCNETGQRAARVEIDAMDRKGRSLVVSVSCSPLRGPGGGVVLLMERLRE
ncbi:CheR family methyltransferase [Amycolatopsis decaplanina]|uniref:protein-glutamate O-methyltransferase n=1 Tax=Amycolatopsis decaplanina DSM 44594 TaxID=1284240 RepID=M2Y8V4_9PSEU|nr:protein-glutamate O-methyltransferase CheR [Amycolatopsis decaplanina]EME51367.1 PAS domain-containing protein [Amycolatopsis decaplanina DSM 44594]